MVSIQTPKTLADGAATPHLGNITFPIIKAHVTDILTVSDEQLVQAMKFFAERMKMVVEPTGCLAAAAVLQKVAPIPAGARVGVVLSGGNVDLAAYGQLLAL